MTTDATAERLKRHVQLVLDNDEGMYRYRVMLTRDAARGKYPRADLADALKDYAEELCDLDNDAVPMMARELLTTALDSIDWHAMATEYLEELTDHA